MEEHTSDAKPEEEVKNPESVEHEHAEGTVPEIGGDAEKVETIDESEISHVSDKIMEEMTDFDFMGEKTESEYGKEEVEGEEFEDVHGKVDETEEGEFEFRKKKKVEAKVRRVDMDVFYPDESKSSMDEHGIEKKLAEAEADKDSQDMDDSEDFFDPTKDYSVVDPSFLDEFVSSEEEHLAEVAKFGAEGKAETLEEIEEEEEDIQQEIYVEPPDRESSDRVYDQICDLETPVSSDESFKVSRFRYIPRRRSHPTQGYREEENKWLLQSQSVQSVEVPSTALVNLMENIAPALKKTLLEIAVYQPSNAIYFMTHSLLHKAKNSVEIGLEPDPHLIQAIVDGQKKKKKQLQIPIIKKKPEIFEPPYAESHISTPPKVAKVAVVISDDDDDEDPSQLLKFQRQYRKAMKNIVTEEKAKRSNLDRKTLLPGPCLGPTSLPFKEDIVSKPKSASVKSRLSQ